MLLTFYDYQGLFKMSGSLPKYLPVQKKVPYNIRMPKQLLDSLNAYAELTGNTTTDVVINALNDLMKNKVVTNTYLSNIDGLAIEIPMLSTEKEMFYNADLLKGLVYPSYDSLGDTIDVKAKSEPYEIFKIPNNLDKFNEKFGYYSMIDGIGGSGFHSGIEFAILPDAYNYRGNVDVFDALYCFYFIVKDNQVRSIELINYLDAINLLNGVNDCIKNNLVLCVKELTALKKEIEFNNTVDEIKEETIGFCELIELAEKFNTGNIAPLGANIVNEIADVEFSNNSEYLDKFLDDTTEIILNYANEIIDKRIQTKLEDWEK